MGLVLLAAGLAHAQDEDINQYIGGYSIIASVVSTFEWSLIYLGLYTLGLGAAIVLQQRWAGFDFTFMWWIIGLWLGGTVMSAVIYYKLFPPPHAGDPSLPATLLTMPLIFGWSMLLCTRSWADLSTKEALVASLLLMFLCAPYFGPTLRVMPSKTMPTSRMPAIIQVAATGGGQSSGVSRNGLNYANLQVGTTHAHIQR